MIVTSQRQFQFKLEDPTGYEKKNSHLFFQESAESKEQDSSLIM